MPRIVKMAELEDASTDLNEDGFEDLPLHLDLTSEDDAPDEFAAPAEEIKKYTNFSPEYRRKVSNEIKKFRRSADGQTSSAQITDDDGLTGYDVLGVVQPVHNLDALAKIYDLSEPHHGAVEAKVANIVGLGYKFIETEKMKRKLEEIEGEEEVKNSRKRVSKLKFKMEEIFEGFNEEETLTEILTKVWRDYETTGNGYLEVSRKADGTVGYLGHIPSTTLRVRRKRDGFVQLSGTKSKFFLNFGDKETTNPLGTYKPNEVIHIWKYSPAGGGYYGVPDIIAAENAIAGSIFAARFNLDFFENKAVPRHLITLKGGKLGRNQKMEILKFFETGLKGQNHRSLFVPLPADTKDQKVEFNIESVDASVQESSFDKYEKSNINKVLMVHRVPISKISSDGGGSLANARDADKTFKEQVCQPEQRMLEKKVNRIVREFGDMFELKLNEMTLTDADTQSKIDERMVKNGIWTANEVRSRDGRPTIKGGDERVDLNAKDKIAQQTAEATTTRQRDSDRSAGATDSAGEGRNPKGEGRTTA